MIEIPAAHRYRIRGAIMRNPDYTCVRAFERAAGFPRGDCGVMLRGPTAFSQAYIARFLDQVRDLLGIDIPVPVPQNVDFIDRLEALQKITKAEADAGRVLRQVAEGWSFPGLHPAPELLRLWPAPLRAPWQTLREADQQTYSYRPPLPTSASTAWSIAVSNERPSILGFWPRSLMARLELTSLRIALQALAARIAEGLPEPEDAPPAPEIDLDAEDRGTRAAYLKSLAHAQRLIEEGVLSRRQIASATGVSLHNVKMLRAIRRKTPDALARVLSGEITIGAAAIAAGMTKPRPKSDGSKRIGAPPVWPPRSAGSLKVFKNVQLLDPELAARVERQEISVNAAGLLCGYLKPKNRKKAA